MCDLPNIFELLYHSQHRIKTTLKDTLVLTGCTDQIGTRWQHRAVHPVATDLRPSDSVSLIIQEDICIVGLRNSLWVIHLGKSTHPIVHPSA